MITKTNIKKQQIQSCLIKIIKPKVIITLGKKALQGLLHCGGTFTDLDNSKLMDNYFNKPINKIIDKGAMARYRSIGQIERQAGHAILPYTNKNVDSWGRYRLVT